MARKEEPKEDKRPLCKVCDGVGVDTEAERSCPACGGSGRELE